VQQHLLVLLVKQFNCVRINAVVQFVAITDGEPLPDLPQHVIDDLSDDQQYLLYPRLGRNVDSLYLLLTDGRTSERASGGGRKYHLAKAWSDETYWPRGTAGG
jgi:hypothetical protein